MQGEYVYRTSDQRPSVFRRESSDLGLTELFGMSCRKGALVALATDKGPVRLRLTRTRFTSSSVHVTWQSAANGLKLKSAWTFSKPCGIWSRHDTIENTSRRSVTVRRCLAVFPLVPGACQVYSQSSRWCRENQGRWQSFEHGEFVLRNDGARTTQGATPYLCLREPGGSAGIAFHGLPRGDWVIRVKAVTVFDSPPAMDVELGLSDAALKLRLAPGESIKLPEILVQSIPNAAPHPGTALLHRYVLERQPRGRNPVAPVVYNTWFDDFEFLKPVRLAQQLEAAKEIGCEVFVVDAGWYGAGEGNWGLQVGDWREKCGAAFDGRMAEFAGKVRAAGLAFGLWMEPERLGASVPVRVRYPSWFRPGEGGCYYPDLENDRARAWVLDEMARLIETYQLAWMKIDFNACLGDDPHGRAFSGYYTAWYALLEELRRRYPHVFLEGCASGGMRLDLNTLSHFDGHFLSDNVNPWDVLRIYQSALLRLPPGRLIKWVALRSAGRTIPKYGTPVDEGDVRLVTPAGNGAVWDSSETVDLDLAARVAMPGVFGLTGDLAGLPGEARQRLRYHVSFFKKWRRFMAGSTAYLLTPPGLIGDRTGWAAIQLRKPGSDRSLVFVYRLDDATSRRRFGLKALGPKKIYRIRVDGAPEEGLREMKGQDMMSPGLEVVLEKRHSAAVLVVG